MGPFNWSRSDRRELVEVTPGNGVPAAAGSFLLPTFLRKLAEPSIKTVLLCGCGGGFDSVHSLTLYPELMRLEKNVVLGSYSFGDPNEITGAADVFNEGGVIAKRVTAASTPAVAMSQVTFLADRCQTTVRFAIIWVTYEEPVGDTGP